jgi:serine/threonine protein kinase
MAPSKIVSFETTFAAYTLAEVIGEGGAGRVFAATDEAGRPWAVKVLSAGRATRERRKRFKNEILFSERMRHPHVVAVVDHGIAALAAGPSPFYVMPRYAGSLRAAMARLTDSSARLRCFEQILSGTEAAHLVGVVHRDIKPENILCDAAATTFVVADFGVAHFTDEELYTAAETAPDSRLANFLYAAPEQRVRGRSVDARSDIYALGLLLNELFTGAVPHGTAYQTIAETSPEYTWLDPIVEAMLRQRPEDRPASIDAIKRALIAHRQDFVTRQRLDEIQRTVVPATAVTDPLAETAPQLVDFAWARGQLTLILDRPVNPKWVTALHSMGSYSSVWGRGPETFSFSDKQARVRAQEHEIQDIINHFKNWLPRATATYAQMLQRERREAEERERAKLRAEQEELERERRVKASVRI